MKISDLLPHYTKDNIDLKETEVSGISIDSRAIGVGELFVAIVGDKYDGHDFAINAVENGAGAVMSDRSLDLPVPVIIVPNTRLALQQMAAYYRNKWQISTVAITGSCGKTTTKNIIANILAGHKETLATSGNYNNLLGLPLTLFKLNSSHEYGVFEVGASYAGEIARLAEILCPDVALITNVGASHIENMGGSVAAIAKEKGALISSLSSNGTAVINCDDEFAPYWESLLGARQWLGFSLNKKINPKLKMRNCVGIYTVENITQTKLGYDFVVVSGAYNLAVSINLLGRHNISNALAAVAASKAIGVPDEFILSGLAVTKPENGRLTCYGGGARLLIDDSYNANPESFNAAIDVLSGCSGKKVLLMGDMGELDSSSVDYHRDIGKKALSKGIDELFCFGDLSKFAAEAYGERAKFYDCKDKLFQDLVVLLEDNWVVLVKGSRFVAMDQLSEKLKGLL
ncbi:MAG: UDP-N-acetylmuramoyl-tripeptide--D-alanyl-D-alanine ligase [Legionellales bacterium]|jgi:UDP-N-acetylmuramoyl-tripeptide--D-alanyl-D-alanine ligase|nr:UDP-N-acetylmuramoyl-tripeptide--D-alanyl-D-alanine ligase [Legionellales bacterium]